MTWTHVLGALAAGGWLATVLMAMLAFYYWSWIGRWRQRAEKYLEELRLRESQLQTCAKRDWNDDCWDCPTIPNGPRQLEERLVTQIVHPKKRKKDKR